MSLASDLDSLPAPDATPRERLLQALEMYESGIALQLGTLRRRHPSLSSTQLEQMLGSWLAREGEV
jgi:hypothetical protein